MKNTKRILATLMTIIMLVGLLAVPAMAANITIKDTNNDNYYTIYKIFDYDAANSADGKPLFKPADGWENFSADSYFILLNGYVVWESGSDAATGAAFAAVAKDYVTDSTPVIAGPKQVSSQVVTFDGLAQGYYLILVTDENGAYKDGTTCGVVAVLDDVSINAKDTATGLPIVEKKVYDDDLTTPGLAASNSVEIGSTVQFQTTVTAKVATAAYVLHDTMAAGFTFNNDVSVTLNGAAVDTANYSVATATTTGDSCSFHVTFTDDFCKKLHSNDSIVVSYTATLNNKSDVVTAGSGNTNSVYLSYTENSTDKTTDPAATTTTYTYQIDVTKTDGTNPLAGAEFQLKNADGKFVNVDSSGYFIKWDTTGSTLSGTDFSIIGLDAGEYTLVETKAPAGYIKANDTTIEITDANEAVTVVNTAGVELPETGGMGTTLFYVAGGALVLGAFVVLMKKRGGQK